jgi:YHS domain-containing protein
MASQYAFKKSKNGMEFYFCSGCSVATEFSKSIKNFENFKKLFKVKWRLNNEQNSTCEAIM